MGKQESGSMQGTFPEFVWYLKETSLSIFGDLAWGFNLIRRK